MKLRQLKTDLKKEYTEILTERIEETEAIFEDKFT